MIKVIIKVGLNRSKQEKEEEIRESKRYLNKDILLFISVRHSNLIY